MNATERARRSDSLYYDTTNRRALCDMIANLESDLTESKAENAKLRELVRDMWFGLYCPTEPTDGCPQCPFNRDGECFFEQRMRELGMDAERGVDE